jgi:hypothetical protein
VPSQRPNNPVVNNALKKVENLLLPLGDGRFDMPPPQAQELNRIVAGFLGLPDLAAFVQGLVDMAEALATQYASESAANAILGAIEREEVLEQLKKLVAAAQHFKDNNTSISPEMDAQMRAGMYRAHLNTGNPMEHRLPTYNLRGLKG